MRSPTERFSATVEQYVKYRPSYPKDLIQLLEKNCGLTPEKVIADVGSGTGFLTKLFLDYGNVVYGIEPNNAMRDAAENYLADYKNFISLNGTAENTTLAADRIDFVTVGTAFHWFDAGKTKLEFQRILKSPGWVILIWNVRNIKESALLRDYEKLIQRFGKDYKDQPGEKFEKTIVADFFTPFAMYTHTMSNKQVFDWEGLQGRLLSTSYSLRPGETGFDEMMQALQQIFERHQQNQRVEFIYDTKIYFGRLR